MADVQSHIDLRDHPCEVCHMVIQAGIKHECDPSICKTCKGTKAVWVEGKGSVTCSPCKGTGKTIWTK